MRDGAEIRYEVTMRKEVEITPVCTDAYHMSIEFLMENLHIAQARGYRTITSMMYQDGQTADAMCMNYWLKWHSYHLPLIPITEVRRYIAFTDMQLLTRAAPP